MKYKAPRQRAWFVERHNGILREALRRTESQCKKEDLIATIEQVLAIVVFMHNSLICINNSTPYQALLGRQPAMLPPLEGCYLEEKAPRSDKDPEIHPEVVDPDAVAQRDMARVCEIAACNIIQAIAMSRLQRAHTHTQDSELAGKV